MEDDVLPHRLEGGGPLDEAGQRVGLRPQGGGVRAEHGVARAGHRLADRPRTGVEDLRDEVAAEQRVAVGLRDPAAADEGHGAPGALEQVLADRVGKPGVELPRVAGDRDHDGQPGAGLDLRGVLGFEDGVELVLVADVVEPGAQPVADVHVEERALVQQPDGVLVELRGEVEIVRGRLGVGRLDLVARGDAVADERRELLLDDGVDERAEAAFARDERDPAAPRTRRGARLVVHGLLRHGAQLLGRVGGEAARRDAEELVGGEIGVARELFAHVGRLADEGRNPVRVPREQQVLGLHRRHELRDPVGALAVAGLHVVHPRDRDGAPSGPVRAERRQRLREGGRGHGQPVGAEGVEVPPHPGGILSRRQEEEDVDHSPLSIPKGAPIHKTTNAS